MAASQVLAEFYSLQEPLHDEPEDGAPGATPRGRAATEAAAPAPQPLAQSPAEPAGSAGAGHQNWGEAVQTAERPLEPSVPRPPIATAAGAEAEAAATAHPEGNRGKAGSTAPGVVDTALRRSSDAGHGDQAKPAAGGDILDAADVKTARPPHLDIAPTCNVQEQQGVSGATADPIAPAPASDKQADREWTIRHVRLVIYGI